MKSNPSLSSQLLICPSSCAAPYVRWPGQRSTQTRCLELELRNFYVFDVLPSRVNAHANLLLSHSLLAVDGDGGAPLALSQHPRMPLFKSMYVARNPKQAISAPSKLIFLVQIA